MEQIVKVELKPQETENLYSILNKVNVSREVTDPLVAAVTKGINEFNAQANAEAQKKIDEPEEEKPATESD